MALVVRIDGQRVEHADLQFTSIRRGGFETCSFSVSHGVIPKRGSDVRVWDGLSTAWHGFVNSPGVRRSQSTGRSASVTAVGYGTKLKLGPYSMIYIDRDLGRWLANSKKRHLDMITNGYQPQSEPTVTVDVGQGAPALEFDLSGPLAGPTGATCEAHYDAGPGNLLSGLVFGTTTSGITPAAAWFQDAFGANQDDFLTGILTFVTDNDATGRTIAQFNLSSPRRVICLRIGFLGTSVSDLPRVMWAVGVAVIGDHGLPVAGTAVNAGFRARDIIEDAVARSGADFEVKNLGGPDADFSVQHAAYYDPTPPEQIIEEMVTLLGWDYGTWEPNALSNVPVFMYGAPPSAVTASVQYLECSNDSIDQVLTDQYTDAIVNSQDVAGSLKRVTVTADNPNVPRDWRNTLALNLGMQGLDTSEAHGAFLLALTQDNARGAGSIQLPAEVRTAGGHKPSHLLRPGRERIAINGIPIGDKLLGPARNDTFSLNRISVTEDSAGVLNTVVEVDSGADLVETLSARIDLATQLAGVGG